MEISQRQTAVVSATQQEVLLRTLASDIASLEHGSPVPVSEHVITHSEEGLPARAAAAPPHSHRVLLLIVLFFIGLIGVGYALIIYPRFIAAPAIIQ